MKIDLGEKYDEVGMCPETKKNKNKMWYPSLYLRTKDKELDIPESGKATIEFRKIGSSESSRDGKPKEYTCDLEVKSITIKDSKKKARYSDEEEVEKGLDEAMERKKGE